MFRCAVGGVKPGMRPMRFEKKMKHAHVPMIGKYRLARFGPIMSFIRS